MEVRPAQASDKQALAKVLKRAFADDPVMRWILPSQDDYERISAPFFELILNQSLSSGSCFTVSGRTGVSLWEAPDYAPTLVSQLSSFFKMAWLLRGNLARGFQLQVLMESYRPRKPFWHLTYIATDPDHQGKGIGASLLEPITRISSQQSLPIYLECSNRDNLSFYRAHQFRLVDEITYPDGPTIWPMLYEP